MVAGFTTTILRGIKHHIPKPLLDRIGSSAADSLAQLRGLDLSPNDPWEVRLRYALGWYEVATTRVCRRLIRPGMNVLDIGAHIGYYTRLFSTLVEPSGTVFAFEPHPDNHQILLRNTSGHANIVCMKGAVSDRVGTAKLFEMSSSRLHSLHTHTGDVDFVVKGELRVESITIDAFLAEHGNPRIDFIKLDIEGHEPAARRGMVQTLERCKDIAMVLEFVPRALIANGEDARAFLTQLTAANFRICAIGRNGSVSEVPPPHEDLAYAGLTGLENLLCLRGRFASPLV